MARRHRVRRVAALAFVVTALAAAFQPANAAGADLPDAAAPPAAVAYGNSAPTSAVNARLAAGIAAENAIAMITASSLPAEALSHIPADFSHVMGYTPVVGHLANGTAVAINPRGGCSVIGGGRPFDLSVPCKAHDLGYDMLRYAHRQGADLSPRARHLVDDKFGADLSTQCATRYSGAETEACDVMAASFDFGVGFNSWRQDFGAPIATAGKVRTVGIIALGVILLYFATRRFTWFAGRSVLRLVRRRAGVLALDVTPA